MELDKIQWKDSFSVGNKSIDNQHKQLITLINILIEANGKGTTSLSLLNEVLRQLVHYSQYHFQLEEAKFRKFQYPEVAKHIKEHQSFIKKIDSFKKNKSEQLSTEMLGYLSNWFTKHTLESDRRLTGML